MSDADGNDVYEQFYIGPGDNIKGYEILEKIDEGNYGQVFKVGKNGKRYAMKVEANRLDGRPTSLRTEIDALKDFTSQQTKFVPKFVMGGREPKFHVVVMDLLGESLKKLRLKSKDPISASTGTWSRLGIQCLYVLKQVHDSGYIHRDVKPANFTMGPVDDPIACRILFILDFGISRKFVKLKKEVKVKVESKMNEGKTGGKSIEIKEKKKKERQEWEFQLDRTNVNSFIGTPTFASPNAHSRAELGRADDVWSLMYMIAEMVKPLPWEFLEGPELAKCKLNSRLKDLFQNDEFAQVEQMLKSCNCYSFPDYSLVYLAFKSVYDKSKVSWMDPYDWETKQMPSYQRWKEKADKRLTLNLWEYTGPDFIQSLRSDPWDSIDKDNGKRRRVKKRDKMNTTTMSIETLTLATVEENTHEQGKPYDNRRLKSVANVALPKSVGKSGLPKSVVNNTLPKSGLPKSVSNSAPPKSVGNNTLPKSVAK